MERLIFTIPDATLSTLVSFLNTEKDPRAKEAARRFDPKNLDFFLMMSPFQVEEAELGILEIRDANNAKYTTSAFQAELRGGNFSVAFEATSDPIKKIEEIASLMEEKAKLNKRLISAFKMNKPEPVDRKVITRMNELRKTIDSGSLKAKKATFEYADIQVQIKYTKDLDRAFTMWVDFQKAAKKTQVAAQAKNPTKFLRGQPVPHVNKPQSRP